jgi:hypothetical protein
MASLDPALMVIPVAPLATVMPEKPWPWTLIDFVMVRAPYKNRISGIKKSVF